MSREKIQALLQESMDYEQEEAVGPKVRFQTDEGFQEFPVRDICYFEYANRKIKLVLGSFVVDCRKELDPMTEGMLKMMGVFAELERNMISQRVKSGMENAKSKGKAIGRPAVTADDIPAIFYRHYPKYQKGEINKKEFSRLCSLSYPTIYKYLRIVEG